MTVDIVETHVSVADLSVAKDAGRSRSSTPWHGRSRLPTVLLTCDLLACLVALASPVGRYALVWAPALLVVMNSAHLYRPRLTLSLLDDLAGIVRCGFTAMSLITVVLVIRGHSHVGHTLTTSLAILLPALLLFRLIAYALVRRARRQRRVYGRVLLVGSTDVSLQLARELQGRPEYGLMPVGMLDGETRDHVDGLPLFGRLGALPDLVKEHGISTVIVAGPATAEAEVVDVVRDCTGLDLEIFVVPRLYQVFSGHQMEAVGGIPLIRLRRLAMRSNSWALKRAFDVCLSAAGLLLASPIIAVAALGVRWECGRGVIFRQERVGRDGNIFSLYKLRSMRPSPEADQATTWNIAKNPAVGPVGRMLRSTSIDELPQLWNVLRGDMSLVGPRPERPHFVSQFSDEHDEYPWRHRVPCGLSGWAQVNGLRGDTSIADRARFDNFYIENWSLGLDLRILLRTVSQVVRRAGA